MRRETCQQSLVAHRDSVHRGPFICDTCGKEYMSIRNLKDHRRIHLGTEFVCEVKNCGRKFTTQTSLKDHVDKVQTFPVVLVANPSAVARPIVTGLTIKS